jgi:hypothetical protein
VLAGCDRRQVSGSRRCCARKGKWLEKMSRGAELYQGLLEALTLACGVVNWSWFWYSESQGVCLPFGCTTTTLHAGCYKLQPLEVQACGRGKERSARRK